MSRTIISMTKFVRNEFLIIPVLKHCAFDVVAEPPIMHLPCTEPMEIPWPQSCPSKDRMATTLRCHSSQPPYAKEPRK